jgi:hypothetical protein
MSGSKACSVVAVEVDCVAVGDGEVDVDEPVEVVGALLPHAANKSVSSKPIRITIDSRRLTREVCMSAFSFVRK